MTRIPLISTAAACALFLIGAGAQAHDEHKPKSDEQEHTEGHAHEHGAGQLDLALQGVELVIELTLPALDVVGFEHPAASKADHDAVHRGIDKLSEGGRLFAFPKAAGCRIARTEVDPGDMEGHGLDRNEKHDHAKDDHDDEHADFQAHYRARCEHPEELNGIELTLFRAFPTARAIRARWITGKGQGAATLTPDRPKLTF
jgi:hypothetical protein